MKTLSTIVCLAAAVLLLPILFPLGWLYFALRGEDWREELRKAQGDI